MTSGHKLLSSAHARDAPLRTIVSRHGHPSRALYHICLSFQALVSRAPHGAFLQHYAAALSKYRAEIAAAIADPGRADDADTDATLHAGLLMCTVGMLQAVPWTYHLAGLSRLLSLRAWPPSSSLASTHAAEVVALLDLPILVVGRRSPCLGLWQQLRKRQQRTPAAADSIDVVTGLPRSLIDLLAGEPAALDEAALRVGGEEEEGALLARLVAAVGAVQAGGDDVVAHDDALWPTFVAALEVARRPERRRRWAGVVAAWFERQVRLDRLNTSRLVWELLEEVRRRAVRGEFASADDVARGWGVEVVLF
ncbi:C6 finger domain protein [Neofusicoccum parvum]|uniref:C6 finger domain protein n=1 Tax=Neofusicoccum parvum TaxID=310453 RepID=A0ACB5S153_9PEZI|nr:C6 finger domain protein [Neofusicoccum parvum]